MNSSLFLPSSSFYLLSNRLISSFDIRWTKVIKLSKITISTNVMYSSRRKIYKDERKERERVILGNRMRDKSTE